MIRYRKDYMKQYNLANKDKVKLNRQHYRKTINGWINITYACMKSCSNRKKIKLKFPNFTKDEFVQWISNQQDLFDKLWDAWVDSSYDTKLKPSVNRLDDYKPYIFNNMELTTWEDNWKKGNKCIKKVIACTINGRKSGVPIIQLNMNGVIVSEFDSANDVYSKLGFDNSYISKCCRGILHHAYGFIWRYKI